MYHRARRSLGTKKLSVTLRERDRYMCLCCTIKCVCLYLETFLSQSVDHLMVTIREKPKLEALLEVHVVLA